MIEIHLILSVIWICVMLTYPSMYDRFLLVVSMGFNVVTVWYAWNRV